MPLKTFLSLFLLLMLLFAHQSSWAQRPQEESQEQAQLSALLKQHRGDVVYVDFWASWCGPCRKSFPWMNKIQLKYKHQGFTVISVNVDTQASMAATFLTDNPANFPIVYDHQTKISQQYAVKGMPSSYLFGRDGELKATHVGFFTKKIPRYEAQIEALLSREVE